MYYCSGVNYIYLGPAKSKIRFKMWIYISLSLKQFSMLRILNPVFTVHNTCLHLLTSLYCLLTKHHMQTYRRPRRYYCLYLAFITHYNDINLSWNTNCPGGDTNNLEVNFRSWEMQSWNIQCLKLQKKMQCVFIQCDSKLQKVLLTNTVKCVLCSSGLFRNYWTADAPWVWHFHINLTLPKT